MAKCTCGNEIGALTTSSPKFGRTYVGKALLIVGGFAIVVIVVATILANVYR